MPAQHSSKYIIRVLEQHGFYFVSQRGSHAKYRCNTPTPRTVIIPTPKRAIPYGTFRSIVRQAGLDKTDFDT